MKTPKRSNTQLRKKISNLEELIARYEQELQKAKDQLYKERRKIPDICEWHGDWHCACKV